MRSYCLLTICKPSDDLSFHLVHRCKQMHALTRAWQNTTAMSFVGDVRVTTFHTHSKKG